MSEKTRKDKFAEIFNSDTMGLLDTPELHSVKRSDEESRLIEGFREISEFYENNQILPQMGGDIFEHRLATRLMGILAGPKKVKVLLSLDTYNLLEAEKTKSLTLDDILGDDPLGLLETDEVTDSIFKLTNVKPTDRLRPDYISRRRVCKNFSDYEEGFRQIHDDLAKGKRRLVEFKEADLQVGRYYVLRGVVLYLEVNNSTVKEFEFKTCSRKRVEGRTKCIFDNGTESTMLFRSLVKAMQIDGFSISEIIDVEQGVEITQDDIQNGHIYVLRSLSQKYEIRQLKDLYKIGYCTTDITGRIKNAGKEPTYLMSDVEVVLSARCYNLSVRKFEAGIHAFFNKVNVLFEIKDDKGVAHFPKEWFIVPLSVIEEAIQIIIADNVEQFFYDSNMQMIVKRGDI